MRDRRPSRSSRRALAAVLFALVVAGCASAPPARQPIPPEVKAALDLLHTRARGFEDLRTLAEITIRRGSERRRLAGALLARAPAALRFEGLSPFGTPVLVVAGDGQSLTVWEVADDRAYLLPASAEANRRWLGLALGSEDLVALLGGLVRPLGDPLVAALVTADDLGPSVVLTGADARQRIWFDPQSGQPLQAEWSEVKTPFRVALAPAGPEGPPAGLRLWTLDGALDVHIAYRNPRLNTGFDSELLRLSVPQHVRIQDLR